MDITRQAKKPVLASMPGQRSLDASLPEELKGAVWIWSGESGNGQQIRQFRKTIITPNRIKTATIAIFAESRFHLWVNGHYLSRGPAFHHPSRRPFQVHDVTAHWREGKNVVAVLVFEPNLPLQTGTPTGYPGLIARLDVKAATNGQAISFPTDNSWSANDATGYLPNVPRRGWALGFIDVLDSACATRGWQKPDFDDSHWKSATVRASDVPYPHEWLHAPLPELRHEFKPVRRLLGHYAVHALPPVIREEDQPSLFGEKLSNEPWANPEGLIVDADLASQSIRVSGLTAHRGAALVLDLQCEYTGQVCFDCACPNPGTIDIGWSELIIDGRPPLMRKRVSYADRLLATTGENHWEPLSFSAGRYIVLVLRGFEGEVEIRNLGMRSTEPSLTWQAGFDSSDPTLNRIADLCLHTIRVGTQEGLMDCPTREQAPYLGDGHLIGRWLGLITGDWRHWRYLLTESFARQSPDGLLRDAVFSGHRRTILDYNLLAVIGAREYLRLTGDLETIRQILPACRKVFRWFDDRRNSAGLIDTSEHRFIPDGEWDLKYNPAADERQWATLLFIDHAGLGWHNVGEPEIDRRGINAGLNAVYVVAREAIAEVEQAVGSEQARDPADAMRTALRHVAFEPHQALFVDGLLNGQRLLRVSQQTNIWCLWAGLCDQREGKRVIEQIFSDNDPNIARCGPYFFAYGLPQMARLGKHELALSLIRKLWKPMVDSDATTMWETFSGDDLDSRCHPWSAAPLEFLLCDVLGLRSLLDPSTAQVIVPRVELLERASGSMMTSRGLVSVAWVRSDAQVTITGELPEGVSATLQSSGGEALAEVSGHWRWAGKFLSQ